MDTGQVLIACRLLHFGALLLMVGTGSFAIWCTPVALRAAANPALLRLTTIAAAVVIVTTPAWLMLGAGNVADGWPSTIDPATVGLVLGGTAFGKVWVWRLVLAVLLAFAPAAKPDMPRWIVTLVVSSLLLATVAMTGHAADDHGWLGVLHGTNQAVHLLAAAVWAGALPALWICVRHWRDRNLTGDTQVMLLRFSVGGHLAVALVLLTGVVETQLIVGHLPTDVSSPYQMLLDLKIVLVAAMIVFAILNRYRAVPRLERGEKAGLRSLIRGTIAEVVLSVAVVAAVSLFGTLDPT